MNGEARNLYLPPGSCAEHGRYRSGCDACRTATSARRRARNRFVAHGLWRDRLVDAAAARRHINDLVQAGATYRSISQASGVSREAIRVVANGSRTRLSIDSERRICNVRAVELVGRVGILGVSRRLCALMANGWGNVDLAPLLGVTPEQVSRWRNRAQPTIRYASHAKVCRLYRDLGDRPGPSPTAARAAQRRGYAGTIFWDDDGDLDDPAARPRLSYARR